MSDASKGWRSVFVHAQDGLRLHARDYGERHWPGLPVVCLPGLSRNAIDFHLLALALSGDARRPRRVVSIDYRGRGESAWDPDWKNYDIRVEAADIAAMLDALGLPEALFVGTSRGGLNTMALAAMRPGALRGAILNDIGPVIEARGLLRIRATVGKLPPPRSLEEAAEMLRHVSDARFPALQEEDWIALAEGAWRPAEGGRPGAPMRPTFDLSLMKPFAALDLEAPLPPLWPLFQALHHVPVLAIRGETSDLLSPETLDAMAEAHPRLERLVVPGQGHAPLLRDPATIARIVAFAAMAEEAPRPALRKPAAAGQPAQEPIGSD